MRRHLKKYVRTDIGNMNYIISSDEEDKEIKCIKGIETVF